MVYCDDLIDSYRQAFSRVHKSRQALQENPKNDPIQTEHLSEMESDLNYVLSWLTNRMEPGPRRGIERRSCYQRTTILDEKRLQYVAQQANWVSCHTPAEAPLPLLDQMRLETALRKLSPRQRIVFTLVYGQRFTIQEAAGIMQIQTSTAKTLILRAKKKMIIFRTG